jgi:hypothetical protein
VFNKIDYNSRIISYYFLYLISHFPKKNTLQRLNSSRLFVLILILGALGCSQQNKNTAQFQLTLSKNYPRWLKAGEMNTEQTSGIAFIGKDSSGSRNFLLADDIGKIHLLKIEDDTVFNFTDIKLSEKVINYFKDYPKMDFEEIAFDSFTRNVYLSVEGNGKDFKNYLHIFKLIFKDNNIYSCQLEDIEALEIKPEDELLEYTKPNIGFEGLAVDSKNFYLGLENVFSDKSFGDSTLIYIVDKDNLTIKKVLSTKKLGIKTICGLFSDADKSLWGVDRNQRLIFHLILDKNLEVDQFTKTDFIPAVPGYTNIPYVSSAESICMDEENNVYVVDDPWYEFYVPPDSVLKKLDKNTINNFKQFIPVIYKYNKN